MSEKAIHFLRVPGAETTGKATLTFTNSETGEVHTQELTVVKIPDGPFYHSEWTEGGPLAVWMPFSAYELSNLRELLEVTSLPGLTALDTGDWAGVLRARLLDAVDRHARDTAPNKRAAVQLRDVFSALSE